MKKIKGSELCKNEKFILIVVGEYIKKELFYDTVRELNELSLSEVDDAVLSLREKGDLEEGADYFKALVEVDIWELLTDWPSLDIVAGRIVKDKLNGE